MSWIFTLVMPLLITLLPVGFLLVFAKPLSATHRLKSTLIISAMAVISGLITPFLASVVCASNLAATLPNDEPRCVTGAVIFLPIGGLMTLVTLVLAVFYSILANKKGKAGI